MSSNSIIGLAAVTPVYREPNLRAEQVTQLVLGETGRILEARGAWRRVRLDLDHYEGWAHAGYLLETDHEVARAWRESASGWSEGAVAQGEDGRILRLPLRARVGLVAPRVDLPNGQRATLSTGVVTPHDRVAGRARSSSPDLWALEHFAGAPYQWGGVTPWGVDCSGLVQTTFLARGLALPRDAAQQALKGEPVDLGKHRPGDLLFFSDEGDRITHVALAGPRDALVHSTVACGGVVLEPWGPGTRASALREQLVAIRRVE
ncbi:MAG: C40 family peptidase [Gemmatimonadota bacterium]|nr:C40 family peptidase [Gemmatimonadota bacterium]MDH5283334.1 C40 family peptidase [Gemmatimonadota bacterium]